MTKLKVACAGLGYFSQFHLEGWTRLEQVHLAGLATRDAERVAKDASQYGDPTERPQAFTDVEEMLETVNPDIFDIITPPVTHADYIRKALKPGRLIICQKPFCTSLEEANAVMSEADAAGTTIVIHENIRFQPWNRKLKQELSRLGQLYSATFRLRPGDGQGEDAYLARQPFFREMPKFLVRETAVHWLDTFRFLFGDMTSLYADLRQLNPVIKGEDAGIIVFEHANGMRSIFDGNRLSDHASDNRRRTMGEFTIEGENGTLTLDGYGIVRFRPFDENEWEELAYSYNDFGFGGDCVYELQKHVVLHLTEGTALENTAKEYLPVVSMEAASYQSAKENCKILL